MVNIRTATPQINRFGTDAERGQSSEWEAVVVEKLRVLWSKARSQARLPLHAVSGRWQAGSDGLNRDD